jgi:monofunctional biosynthetic peptidoglycan transglycosylase
MHGRAANRAGWRRRLGGLATGAAILLVAVPLAATLVLRFVAPPLTPFMVIRSFTRWTPIDYHWVPLKRVSPHLVRAVVAAEDARFMHHRGFDWIEVESAMRASRRGRRLRGASTISMQCARCLFLWPGRDVIRKGLEAYLTVWLEAMWSKRRILETYLNVVEWGAGRYGCEAAARNAFGTSCADLTVEEAARLAAILPAPWRWSAREPGRHVRARVATILARMPLVDVPH